MKRQVSQTAHDLEEEEPRPPSHHREAKLIRWLDRTLSLIESTMIVVLTLAGLGMAFLQVILRYVFNTGLHWLEAGLVTALIWAMLFGASKAVSEGIHPRVELLPLLVGAKFRAVLNFAALSAAMALSAYLFWDGWFYATFIYKINALHPELGIKQVYPFMIVPIATALITLRYGLVVITLFSKPSAEHPDAHFREVVRGDTKPREIDQ